MFTILGNEGRVPLLSILIFPWDILVPSSIFLNSVRSLTYASLECKGEPHYLQLFLLRNSALLTFQRSYVEMLPTMPGIFGVEGVEAGKVILATHVNPQRQGCWKWQN